MWIQRFLIGLFCATTALAALAFDRPFPPIAKRGTMSPAAYPAIVIDGLSRHLSPGALIRNQDNLIEPATSLRGGGYAVLYTENEHGDIDRVWLLTGEETTRYPLSGNNRNNRAD